MHRFTQIAMRDEEKVQYEALRQFVNSYFPNDHEMVQKQLPVMKYIQYITDALRYSRFYTASYYIKRDAANYFALFFISSSIYGFEKILEVKWELDEDNGRGFKTPPLQKGLFDDQFAEETKEENAAILESILLELLQEPKTNIQIYEETLKHGFLPKHTNEVFKKWQQNNPKFKVFDITTGKEARKRSYYISWEYYKIDKVQFSIEKS